nr:immunoglobulin light chain junction region [Macaca mulatta]MOV84310.1 immunoglobulin light chain junction region [Macaca mulatta]
CQQHDSSPWTF